MISLLKRLFRPRPTTADSIHRALARFLDPEADTLAALRGVFACLRPIRADSEVEIRQRYQMLIATLEADSELLSAFRSRLVGFFASRRLVTFFTDSGILPGTGFFSEWWRILGHRLLPEAPDPLRLKDCVHDICDRADDWQWMQRIPPEESRRFWTMMLPPEGLADKDWKHIQAQLLDALLLLAHRISGLGVEAELLRATPDFEDYTPRFVALSAEALEFTHHARLRMSDPGHPMDDGRHFMVIIDQCRDALLRTRKRAQTVGTSLHLTYLLTRGEQSLDRLSELIDMLQPATDDTNAPVSVWAGFLSRTFLAENRRNSLRYYWQQLSRVLALRVTENAARSGEHYLCETPDEYHGMWRSAAGAGVLIGLMAFLKIETGALHAPLAVEAFLFSMIYGLGFVLIYLLGFTVATKQPAMTAQALAGHLSDIRPGRTADLERVADLASAVTRSQIAAILGNVLVALPVAIAVGWGLGALEGGPVIPMEKAAHLIDDLDPLGWALPHAAIAGFYLYLSGLLSGYFDNLAAYAQLAPRIARIRWLRFLLGDERAWRMGDYLQQRLGGIMGNFLFGCMLGSTGVIGKLLGLPLDIRHIAFSSANLGYALTGFEFALPWQALMWGLLGVAGIGIVNLTVSFLLALRMALNARQAEITGQRQVLRAIWLRLRRQPSSFLLPAKPSSSC